MRMRFPMRRSIRRTRSCGLFALACVVSLGFAPGASADIYWSTGSSIGRANLDGTGVDQNFITGMCGSFGVAVNGTHVFWVNYGCDSIGRANLDGSDVNQSFISGLNFCFGIACHPGGMAIDGAHIYWYMGGSVPNSLTGGSALGRANLDGSDVIQQWLQGQVVPPQSMGVAVDDAHIYSTENHSIMRFALDGSGLIEHHFINLFSFDPQALNSPPNQVAVDGAHIYWTDWWRGTIGRANLDGSGVNQDFITDAGEPSGAGQPAGIAVNNAYIYWTNGNSIARANLDGTGVNLSYITGVTANASIALDPPRPVDVRVDCLPGAVIVPGGSTHCTTTVTDQGVNPLTPSGTVSFTTNVGSLSPSSCTLTPGSPFAPPGGGLSASCAVIWSPPSTARPGEFYAVHADYSGDDAHAAGSSDRGFVTTAPGGTLSMPTSKDQCKNGGWKQYPGFKNQGDCVSYVATGGKNTPSR